MGTSLSKLTKFEQCIEHSKNKAKKLQREREHREEVAAGETCVFRGGRSVFHVISIRNLQNDLETAFAQSKFD